MNTKRGTFGMGTLAALLLTGTASAGVHLEFKHERFADRPTVLGAPTQFRFAHAGLLKGEIVDLDLRREGSRREQAVRAARVDVQRRAAAGAGSLEQVCQEGALPAFVAAILRLKGACN